MMGPKVLPAMGLALLASLAGNVMLARAYLGQRDAAAAAAERVTSVKGERDGARSLANACSDAVQDLREQAEKRKSEADAARSLAAGRARDHERRADEILATAPAVPGDACASAQHQVDSWLQRRARP
ncbi:hypothetical protein [Comamonas terrae]|uniref:DUF2514 family protein n=1 Tax=Comamonas terrae TaxID=673548 RepID=A0ABW5URY5_9BURK|nr:hypothetical protein [Comamonas terrae]